MIEDRRRTNKPSFQQIGFCKGWIRLIVKEGGKERMGENVKEKRLLIKGTTATIRRDCIFVHTNLGLHKYAAARALRLLSTV